MSVSIKFPNFTLDCGYFGFKQLRDEMCKHVKHKGFRFCVDEFNNRVFNLKPDFLETLNKRINDIDFLADEGSSADEKRYLKYFNNFIWASDCSANMTPNHAKSIWHYIKDAEEDFKFGYEGKKDCATFQQFKQGIKDCVDNDEGFEWYKISRNEMDNVLNKKIDNDGCEIIEVKFGNGNVGIGLGAISDALKVQLFPMDHEYTLGDEVNADDAKKAWDECKTLVELTFPTVESIENFIQVLNDYKHKHFADKFKEGV